MRRPNSTVRRPNTARTVRCRRRRLAMPAARPPSNRSTARSSRAQPQDNRPPFFGAFGNPYTTGNQRNNGNRSASVWRLVRAERRAAEQSAAAAVRREHAPCGTGQPQSVRRSGAGLPEPAEPDAGRHQAEVRHDQPCGHRRCGRTGVRRAVPRRRLHRDHQRLGCMCRPPARCPTSSPTRPVPVPPRRSPVRRSIGPRWPRKCPIPWWPSTWRPATAKPRAPAW